MSTHAGAMLITALAYGYARRHAHDARFSFGTGKLGDLSSFASAIILALVALLIAWESLQRLAQPVPISFGQAILVASVGLIVNLVSAWLLRDEHGHDHGHHHGHRHHPQGHGHQHGHDHDHDHDHDQDQTPPQPASPGAAADVARRAPMRDNNLRAAYLHVMADALTSVLAIVALLLGRSYGWVWADPLMGVVGAVVIARWAWFLVRDSGRVLLDAAPASETVLAEIRKALAPTGDRITDLHVWQIGPGHFAAIVSLISGAPRDTRSYKAMLAHIDGLSHVTLETQRQTGPTSA